MAARRAQPGDDAAAAVVGEGQETDLAVVLRVRPASLAESPVQGEANVTGLARDVGEPALHVRAPHRGLPTLVGRQDQGPPPVDIRVVATGTGQ
jgi:hypothetical protein